MKLLCRNHTSVLLLFVLIAIQYEPAFENLQVSNLFFKRTRNSRRIFNVYHNNNRRFKSRSILNSVKNISYLSSKTELCCLCRSYSVCPHRNHDSVVSNERESSSPVKLHVTETDSDVGDGF